MNDFKAKRAVDEYSGKIEAPPGEVFPLLCPTREYDWLDGWACDMIYSDSGFAENNCIFKSEFASNLEGTWITVRRDEESFVFEFVIVFPDLAVARTDISLADNGDGTTTLHWARTMTGLRATGNQMLDHMGTEFFVQRMDWLIDSLNHYLKTGEMLKEK